MVEGTSLLRKHLGLNLNPGFESLRLRQIFNARASGRYFFEYRIPCGAVTEVITGIEYFRLGFFIRPFCWK